MANLFKTAAGIVVVVLAYNEPDITDPLTAPAAAMVAYSIQEVQNMNYAAQILRNPGATPVHNCEDGLRLVSDLNIPEVSAYPDPTTPPTSTKLYCLVQVGEMQAEFTLNVL